MRHPPRSPAPHRVFAGLALTLLLVMLTLHVAAALAQDSRELAAEKSLRKALGNEHPLVGLMRLRNSTMRPELKGVHPRVYFTDEEIAGLKQRARTTHRELWQRALTKVRALTVEPPAPPAQARRVQNEVGLGIAEAALAYRIEGDRKYLDAAKKYMDAAVRYEVWGYKNNKPDVDLAAGHLLYGLGWGYDLLYHELSPKERQRYRAKLTRQARLMFDYFKPKAGRTYAYSQNHVFIPVAGLAIAAYALYDEEKDAPRWAALARAIFDRVLATYSTDGYYYEGFEYWIFSTPWLVHYLDAHAHATGEDLYDHPGLRQSFRYVAHSMLPGTTDVFDFGDIWEGLETRARRGKDYERTRPGGHLESNYNLLYRFAARFRNPEAQGVAQWLADAGQVNAEEAWSLAWYDAALPAVPVDKQPTWHHFPDHEVVYWRSDWSSRATAFAFKCGPPEGHHTAALLDRFPDWRLSAGHAHPDAGSFIVFAHGAYLTGDSGYAGVPLTAHHNTVLVDGHGQGREGRGHDAWDDVPYERLNQTEITEVKVDGSSVRILGEVTAAYMPDLGLARFVRRFEYAKDAGFTITDTLQADRRVAFTALIHADSAITPAGERGHRIEAGDAALSILVEAPRDARMKVEPNVLTTAGPPGAVDKGERVERGQRLAISTAPATSAEIVVKLVPGWRPRRSE
jgi:hypothetical protein